jgi:hypothetical protein
MAIPLRDRHPRVTPGLTVIVDLGGRGGLARARELSLTGCYVEGIEMPVGGNLRVELPMEGNLMAIHCRVVRIEGRADGLFNVAVAFQDLAWSEICAIARYVAPRAG